MRERLVRTSIKYLAGLSKRAGDDCLKAEIAEGYRRAADAQGLSGGSNLGPPDEARDSLAKAAALLLEARAAAPGDRGVLRGLPYGKYPSPASTVPKAVRLPYLFSLSENGCDVKSD